MEHHWHYLLRFVSGVQRLLPKRRGMNLSKGIEPSIISLLLILPASKTLPVLTHKSFACLDFFVTCCCLNCDAFVKRGQWSCDRKSMHPEFVIVRLFNLMKSQGL